jgi:hypothetical protein
MLRKTLFVAVAAILTTLAFAADAKAWAAYYYSNLYAPVYRAGVYGGYPVGTTVAIPAYQWYGGNANMSYYYGGGGVDRTGYNRRW